MEKAFGIDRGKDDEGFRARKEFENIWRWLNESVQGKANGKILHVLRSGGDKGEQGLGWQVEEFVFNSEFLVFVV